MLSVDFPVGWRSSPKQTGLLKTLDIELCQHGQDRWNLKHRLVIKVICWCFDVGGAQTA